MEFTLMLSLSVEYKDPDTEIDHFYEFLFQHQNVTNLSSFF